MRNNHAAAALAGDVEAGATAIVRERNRYYTGKHMTARDFRTDPAYFLSRHRLHNRLLHGWGVVYGLRVKRHPNDECANRWVVVEPGVAIDCYGRDLILDKEIAFDLYEQPQLSHCDETPAGKGAAAVTGPNEPRRPDGPRLLCLRYSERPVEFTPALYSDDNHDPAHKEANRVREEVALELITLAEAGPDCWRSLGDATTPYSKDDCDSPGPEPGRAAEDGCPWQEMVPLALVEFCQSTDGQWLLRVDSHGRRRVPGASENLTRIVKVCWPHGGTMTLSKLRDQQGRLTIHFERPLLLPADDKSTAAGVNIHTFTVQYGGVQRALEFMDGEVVVDNAARTATFIIDPDFLWKRQSIIENTVFITLKCDFILDCHGEAVDGNFIGGRFPTGNGIPGGVFESWFEVVHDNGYGQEK